MTQPALRLTVPNQTGEQVLELQKHLGLHGITIEADGHFGVRTKKALQKFQRSKNLPPSGELDPATSFLLFGGMRLSGGMNA